MTQASNGYLRSNMSADVVPLRAGMKSRGAVDSVAIE
jgi:hypothetical protein